MISHWEPELVKCHLIKVSMYHIVHCNVFSVDSVSIFGPLITMSGFLLTRDSEVNNVVEIHVRES